MDIVDKVNELKVEKKIPQTKIANTLGIHPPHLSGILNRKGRRFQAQHIPKLAKLFGVSESYLLGDEEIKVKYIPLIGIASCGVPNVAYSDDIEYIPVSPELARDGVYAIRADGESMEPKISHGDIIICDKDIETSNGDIVHYTTIDGESGVKKFLIDEKGVVTLMPINTNFPPVMCDKRDVKTAKAVKLIQNL